MKKPYITECADGSIMIEWISKDERVGLSIEPVPYNSFWYHASKKDDGFTEYLPDRIVDALARICSVEGI